MTALVIDTNVLVAACWSDGAFGRLVVKRCLRGHYRPIIGAACFAEYEEVFGRDALFSASPLSRPERMEVFRGFLAVCRWMEIYSAWRPILPDEADADSRGQAAICELLGRTEPVSAVSGTGVNPPESASPHSPCPPGSVRV